LSVTTHCTELEIICSFSDANQFESIWSGENKLSVWHCIERRWMAEGDETGIQWTCAACARRTYSVCLWTLYEWTGPSTLCHSQCKSRQILPTYVL